MKRQVYLRISNKSKKMDACSFRKIAPLDNGVTSRYGRKQYYPTVCIKLNIDIPDEVFNKAMAEIDLKINSSEICSEIIVEESA